MHVTELKTKDLLGHCCEMMPFSLKYALSTDNIRQTTYLHFIFKRQVYVRDIVMLNEKKDQIVLSYSELIHVYLPWDAF